MKDKYLFTEEELIKFKKRPLYDVSGLGYCVNSVEKVVREYLKSKQPVEVIAEGKVDTFIDALPDNGIGFINNKDIADKLYTHNGNKVKLYLEVIDE